MAGERLYTLSEHAFDFFTGTIPDRDELLRLHEVYLRASAERLNEPALRAIWSADPRHVFFHGTGANYRGIESWLAMWNRNRGKFAVIEPWRSTDVRLTGNSEVAAITAERTASLKWLGDGPAPSWSNKNWRSRSTEIFRREPEGWRCTHIHVSDIADGK